MIPKKKILDNEQNRKILDNEQHSRPPYYTYGKLSNNDCTYLQGVSLEGKEIFNHNSTSSNQIYLLFY